MMYFECYRLRALAAKAGPGSIEHEKAAHRLLGLNCDMDNFDPIDTHSHLSHGHSPGHGHSPHGHNPGIFCICCRRQLAEFQLSPAWVEVDDDMKAEQSAASEENLRRLHARLAAPAAQTVAPGRRLLPADAEGRRLDCIVYVQRVSTLAYFLVSDACC